MSPLLTSLISLQALDTAAEQARRRLADLPLAERASHERVTQAQAAVDAAKQVLAENHRARRDLEKQVAEIETRLGRFEDHKAAVKTNQEFTALLSEIATAKAGREALEEQILLLLEAADGITQEIRTAEQALSEATSDRDTLLTTLQTERQHLDAELRDLGARRATELAGVPAAVLAKYDQILKQRRMVAVAAIDGDICGACHVRLRPAVVQQIRRNDQLVQCDSCQRILYAAPKAPVEADAS